jgi:SAM-dependent methyltransferase
MSERLGIHVPGEAYPYLQMQRGAISDMRDDQAAWLQLYADALYSEFDCIEPYLPPACDAILDIGSGLGGIDVLLTRHFGNQCEVTLLDGLRDAPFVQSHDQTFNDMTVARHFLEVNGVNRVHCLDAGGVLVAPSFFDLVVSFKAWCFHIEPLRYINFVRRYSIPGHTRIIVDMRGGSAWQRGNDPDDRPHEWMRAMSGAFRHVCMVHYGAKFETHLFEAQ